MPLSFKLAKKLRKGYSVIVDDVEYHPLQHKRNSHRDTSLDKITHLRVGNRVICYLDGILEKRIIREIEQVNYLPRFKVGEYEDVRKWVGKTKILGIEKISEEITIEYER